MHGNMNVKFVQFRSVSNRVWSQNNVHPSLCVHVFACWGPVKNGTDDTRTHTNAALLADLVMSLCGGSRMCGQLPRY